MLNTRKTTTGKIYAPIESLSVWDKNPRYIKAEDLERLERQLNDLGQYKPLLVTEDGIVIGGNMRLRVMQDLVAKGDERFKEVWVTELGFGQTELSFDQQQEGVQPKFKALIDGKVEEREFASVQQIMIEYALSDNDGAGAYDQQELVELVHPYQELIPQNQYKLELAPSVQLETFIQGYVPPTGPKLDDENNEDEEKRSKIIIMKMQFTPEQFAQVEPMIEKAKVGFGLENNTDLFTKLLEEAVWDETDVTPAATVPTFPTNQSSETAGVDNNETSVDNSLDNNTSSVDNSVEQQNTDIANGQGGANATDGN